MSYIKKLHFSHILIKVFIEFIKYIYILWKHVFYANNCK